MQTSSPLAGLTLGDLRLLQAIAECGSLGGAATRLGVDHSSAFRRLRTLEERIGARLFNRARRGYTPTPAGELAIDAAERISEELIALDRRLLGEDLRLSGVVRITTTDTLLHVVVPLLAEFREREPGIVVEVAAGNAIFDLSRRDADLAIRPTASVPEHLIARRVAMAAFAPYASPIYLARRSTDTPLHEHDWLSPDASLSHASSARWIAEHVPHERIVHRADSLLALMQAAKAGLGVTVLPCYLGDCEPVLRRIGATLRDATVPVWLITHPDLRQVRRIGALADFLLERLREQAALFSGDTSR